MSVPRRVVWVSTSLETRGGVASYARVVKGTPLWDLWSIRHVATHQDGAGAAKVGRFVRGLLELWLLLLLRRPALIHLHTSARGSFVRKSILAWSARFARVPIVLHVHDGGFSDFYDRQVRPFRRFIRDTLTMADAVVALGPSWAGRLREIAPGARFVVVPNAVSLPPSRPHRVISDELKVLFVGRVGVEKGVPVLLRAWCRVLEQLPPGTSGRLVAAGDGDVDRFRAMAADLGLAEEVEFTGWVSTERVNALLRDADVLVLPSRWEGQPMSVLEAMAHGVPVVATAVGGIPDLVDKTCGILVDPDDVEGLVDALTRLLSDPELRSAMGSAGRRRVGDEFDVNVTWRQLDALYSEVLG